MRVPLAEVTMFRTLLLTLILALAAVAWLQWQRAERMEAQLAEQAARMEAMEGRLRVSEDIGGLFTKFIADNRRIILDLKRSRQVTVTAYSPRVRETDSTPFTTASNRPVRQGIVAVSRDLFNAGWVFGKKVYLAGLGLFTIDDLMASGKRNQIDIFMHDTDEAIDFGKRKIRASLLDS